ncbi:twin-arginine translocation signal domain-containing protein, partial [Candidatus Nomurabacteria bacterium]|nr:twin-arginine translocation signal domain-containing protein [Candidatus Nomurabacteria bacterium]
MNVMDRRDFLKLAGIGGVVFMSGIGTIASAAEKMSPDGDFFFVQLSDTHW